MSRTERVDRAYLVLSIVDTVAAASDSPTTRAVRRVTKPLLMPTLVARLLLSGRGPSRSRRGQGTLAGLALSTVGDVALLKDEDRSFVTGLGAFLTAHLAYTGAFLSMSQRFSFRRALPAVAVAGVVVPSLARRAGRMAVPAALYGTVISGMLAAALQVDRDSSAGRRISTGAALFVLSDSLIGLRRFVLSGRPSPGLDAAVMATYTAGQWLIATGATSAPDPPQR
ncbi:MAG TPA: lysoplasmalogenase [Actinomycetales bacterium]|nr:lysoplasmalogenase [Actinomycetales bacterium]